MNYKRLTSRHTAMLARHNNSVVEVGVTTLTGGDEFTPPTETTVWTPVGAVVSGVDAEWVDGTAILSTDLSVQLQADPVPAVGDYIRIDGDNLLVKQVTPIREGIGYLLRVRG